MISFISVIFDFVFSNIVLTLIIVVLFSERIANLIPDSKTGFLGKMRKVFRAISAKTPNVK